MENFDYQFTAQIRKVTTTKELDKIAFNRVRSLARSLSEPERSLILAQLNSIRKYLGV